MKYGRAEPDIILRSKRAIPIITVLINAGHSRTISPLRCWQPIGSITGSAAR